MTKDKNDKLYFFVSSTIPARYIAETVKQKDNFQIVVDSEPLARAFRQIERARTRNAIAIVPAAFIRKLLFYVIIILKVRFSGGKAVFFHECCNPYLDLSIWLFAPKGEFRPLVNMDGFQEIAFSEFPKSKLSAALKWLLLQQKFKYFRSPRIGDAFYEYAMAFKQYPASIEQIGTTRLGMTTGSDSVGENKCSKAILFLTGKSAVSDKAQKKVFNQLIREALNCGYCCRIKDHPNPKYRLKLDNSEVVVLDPETPAELHLLVAVEFLRPVHHSEPAHPHLLLQFEVLYGKAAVALCRSPPHGAKRSEYKPIEVEVSGS